MLGLKSSPGIQRGEPGVRGKGVWGEECGERRGENCVEELWWMVEYGSINRKTVFVDREELVKFVLEHNKKVVDETRRQRRKR